MSRFPVTASSIMILTGAFVSMAPAKPMLVGDPRSGENLTAYEFSLGNDAWLTVDVGDVDVWVQRGAPGTARVEFFTSGKDLVRVRDHFENDLRFRVEGDEAGLLVESRQARAVSSPKWKSNSDIDIWVVVTVPREIDANIATRDGDIHVDNLEGDVGLRTSDGDAVLGEMAGKLQVDTADGDVAIEVFSGSRMEVKTEHGSFRAPQVRAEFVSVQATEGSVALPDVVAGSVAIRAKDGDVTLGVEARVVRASCEGADLVIELRAPAEADLRGDDGDIYLTLSPQLDVNLDLQGEAVSARGTLDLRGRLSDRYISGSLNAGGPLVRAEAVDGRIVLSIRGSH